MTTPTLDEHLLSTPPGLARGRMPEEVLAIGLHVPRRAVVLLVRTQDGLQLGLDDRIADGGDNLHPPGEVARHPVGRADEELGRATVLEAVDPAVLQESAEGAEDLDRRRQPWDPCPQAAEAADVEDDGDAGQAAR